ncbi:hypothetical protein JDV02_004468 [Purpureocillium takamizusanense]|uniref:YHYH domain-containing protein n=1 Tax=Purpureocillium takamizusanense TaxID=2060973 RepID=A0A9Q8VAT0_9HYPO|nr:uncharacterized protein JDV02_004468 [Purpureocillium takamizusanense]UNI18184.1 hypothetical protein JDV02_004468 [Purpureocillium takamizusanense]
MRSAIFYPLVASLLGHAAMASPATTTGPDGPDAGTHVRRGDSYHVHCPSSILNGPLRKPCYEDTYCLGSVYQVRSSDKSCCSSCSCVKD